MKTTEMFNAMQKSLAEAVWEGLPESSGAHATTWHMLTVQLGAGLIAAVLTGAIIVAGGRRSHQEAEDLL